MDIADQIKKMFGEEKKEDFDSMEDEALDSQINEWIHDLEFKGMSSEDRDKLKEKVDRARKVQYDRYEGPEASVTKIEPKEDGVVVESASIGVSSPKDRFNKLKGRSREKSKTAIKKGVEGYDKKD